MKSKKWILALVFSVLALSILIFLVCGGLKLFQKPTVDSHVYDVTLIQLIATPERYDGKLVRVIGVGNLEFEGDGLYLGKEDFLYRTRNCIWLDIYGNPVIPYEESKQYNGKYVLVEGTFDKDNLGHWSLYHGAITDITRYEPALSERELAEGEQGAFVED